MPTLELEVRVNAARSVVYEVAKDVESFPSFMPDVESIGVIERSADGSSTLTKWVGLVPEFRQKIRWTEEDVWNTADFTCVFHQTEGEYQEYSGVWRFVDEGTATVFQSTLTYEIEIPLIGPLLKSLIAKKMRDNTEKILHAIKLRAEERK
jgi:ribosome-associated toxin RatA of RatAB toxin-antitoxin module